VEVLRPDSTAVNYLVESRAQAPLHRPRPVKELEEIKKSKEEERGIV
jgi:hypothetical protein